MNISEFIMKFRSRMLWLNIAAMAAVVAVFIASIIIGMDIYTNHGKKITLPDVRHHAKEDAEKVLTDLGLIVEIRDTGYVKSQAPGSILEMTPNAGIDVKPGRIIYLTINALDTPMLTLPDIIDNSSYREALAKLTSMGFKIGDPQYIPGEKDWIYGIKVKGRSLSKGDRVSVEDLLIIQVGSGMRDESDPDLYISDPEPDYPEMGDISSDEDDFEEIY